MGSSSAFIKSLKLPTMKEINILRKRKEELYNRFKTCNDNFFKSNHFTKEFRTSRNEWSKTQDGKEYDDLNKKLDEMYSKYKVRCLLRRLNISSMSSLLNKLVRYEEQLSSDYVALNFLAMHSKEISDTGARQVKEIKELIKVDNKLRALGIK